MTRYYLLWILKNALVRPVSIRREFFEIFFFQFQVAFSRYYTENLMLIPNMPILGLSFSG